MGRCSVDFKVTFEGKGVLDAKDRLTRVSGDVREPFPKAVADAKVRQPKCIDWTVSVSLLGLICTL